MVEEAVSKKKRVNGRTKGHAYERALAKKLREMGFEKCTTSRFSSKEMDDKKVDLCGLPFNIQAKAVEKLGCVHTILDSMPKEEKLNLVFHKKNNKGTIVCMTEKDFLNLVSTLLELGHFKTT